MQAIQAGTAGFTGGGGRRGVAGASGIGLRAREQGCEKLALRGQAGEGEVRENPAGGAEDHGLPDPSGWWEPAPARVGPQTALLDYFGTCICTNGCSAATSLSFRACGSHNGVPSIQITFTPPVWLLRL